MIEYDGALDAVNCSHGLNCPHRCQSCGLHMSDALPPIGWLGDTLSRSRLCAICEHEQDAGHALVCAPALPSEGVATVVSVSCGRPLAGTVPARQIYSWGHNGQRGAAA